MKIKKIFILIISLFLIGCSNISANEKKKDVGVKENNKALNYFRKHFPEKEIIKCSEKDINGDKINDLVVIFKDGKKENSMVVVFSENKSYEVTNKVHAPISNQNIQFKDIDNKIPIEIIVSGSKNNKIGYAVFRLEDGKIIDIFGDGMDDCC
ncbi:hypothetical protein CLPU_7c00140 [Gottschalkia purinilytica]|uniref:Lipoprotein n=1 Tax=Gottschalkia purinilytica TaxID=1503 RepID=A0A0L0WA81_GOTPU|nr:Cys-Cys-COOH (seleno)protein SaoC [Gottschalkia purinilytica]KNF08386.1 hypothetical protein CLPU_7c00140 [Gottschalkia purinilytica]